MNYWFVICPEPQAPGVWNTWYKENCVAIGWPPPSFSLDGDTDEAGWDIARARAQRVSIGDIVIPYLLQYRLGTPGEVTRVAVADSEWRATVPKGGYASNPDDSELGRRIEVRWLTEDGPPQDKVAVVPKTQRTSGGEAKQTITSIGADRFRRISEILKNRSNWVEYKAGAAASISSDENVPPSTETKAGNLAFRETLVRSILAQNLDRIEVGLKPHPDFGRLEEVTFDLGRFDILCQDAHSRTTVLELQLGYLDDGHIGKVCRYYGWLKKKYEQVRVLLLFENALPETVEAYKIAVPWVELRKFMLTANIEFRETMAKTA